MYVCIHKYLCGLYQQGTAVTTYEEVHHHERHEDKDADGNVRLHEVIKERKLNGAQDILDSSLYLDISTVSANAAGFRFN